MCLHARVCVCTPSHGTLSSTLQEPITRIPSLGSHHSEDLQAAWKGFAGFVWTVLSLQVGFLSALSLPAHLLGSIPLRSAHACSRRCREHSL